MLLIISDVKLTLYHCKELKMPFQGSNLTMKWEIATLSLLLLAMTLLLVFILSVQLRNKFGGRNIKHVLEDMRKTAVRIKA